MSPLIQVAVIGAGFSGAVATRKLLDQGFAVTIFDKSKGTGGRLSACRIASGSADLGAPWFEFNQDVQFDHWLRKNAQLLSGVEREVSVQIGAKQRKTCSVFQVSDRMSVATRKLIEGARLVSSVRVDVVWPETEHLLLRDIDTRPLGYFDAVIIATPAPQAIPLLDAVPRFAHRAAKVKPSAAWVMVVSSDDIHPECDLYQPEDGIISRIVADGRKLGHCAEPMSWVIEATQQWSEQRLELSQEQVAKALLSSFCDYFSISREQVELQRVHRWLYARQAAYLSVNSLFDPMTNIAVCGDWMAESGLSGAWRSGEDVAEQLISHFRK